MTIPARGEWLWASDWMGRTWLDGEEASTRCRGVLMDGERPIMLELYVLGADGQPRLNFWRTAIVTERRTGAIRVELQRRGDHA